MKAIKLTIKTENTKYQIFIGNNLISKISNIIADNSIKFKKCLLIIDNKVPRKMINKIQKSLNKKKLYTHMIIANENNKSQKSIDKILKILLDKNFSREDCLISIGGGITGDIGGFAASIFKRGMKFINIPTTLLSQVDSSIGGKTGINTLYGKNLIGSFYQPNLVISDSEFLKTLKKRELICGYGEILKHAIIANKNLFFYLNKNFFNIISLKKPFIEKTIFESCKIKKAIVEKDEKEKDLRKVLNFGHTFAHSYEASLNFSKKLNHGEAVLLGINTALKFSNQKKNLDDKTYNLITNHFKKYKLPSNIRNYFSSKDVNKILLFMAKDKKNNSDDINLILLKKIGRPIINKRYKKIIIESFIKNQLTN